ncbi:MAG: CBS domain-containing protein [Euryarchaeota archaeon]|nr:CBS domain-containing protein [Euryarchaeota archaeon]
MRVLADLQLHADIKAIQKNEPLHKAYGWLRGDTKTVPIILDGKKAYGIVNTRIIMKRRLEPNASIGAFTQPVPTVDEETEALEVLEKFSQSLAPYLPYIKGGKLKGYVDPLDILYQFDDGPDAQQAFRAVPPLGVDDTMGAAVHRFHNETVDDLPVVDAEGRIQGVLTRRAILEFIDAAHQNKGRTDRSGEKDRLLDDPVRGFMDPGWVEIDADTPYREMLPRLKKNAALYVTTNGAYRGLITPAYLARAVFETFGSDPDEALRAHFNIRDIPEHRRSGWARERQSK